MKWLKGLAYLFAFLSFLVIGINLSARWVIERALENGLLQTWVSESLGTQIQYVVADVEWEKGNASIHLNQVEVLKNRLSFLSIPELGLHVNALSSLLHFKLIFNQVDISGLVLKLQNTEDGIRMVQSNHAFLEWKNLWPFIEPQRKILIHHARVLSDQDEVLINQFDLNVHRTASGEMSLNVEAYLGGEHDQPLKFSGVIKQEKGGPLGELRLDLPPLRLNWQGADFQLDAKAYLFLREHEMLSQVQSALCLHDPAHREDQKITLEWNASWNIEEDFLQAKSSKIQVHNPWIHAEINGPIQLALDGSFDPEWQIKGSILAKELQHLLPMAAPLQTVNPKLSTWILNNVKSIDGLEASFVWNGHPLFYPTGPKVNEEDFFTLEAAIKGASFFPDVGWPLIEKANPNLHLENDSLTMKANFVHALGVQGDQVEFELSHWDDDLAILKFHIQTASTAEAAQEFLLQSPLVQDLSFLKYTRLSGPLRADLILSIPLDPRPNRVEGRIDLLDNQLWPNHLEALSVEHLQGSFYLEDGHVESTEPIRGIWLGEPITAMFKNHDAVSVQGNQLEVQGVMPLSLFLLGLNGPAFSDVLKGSAPFHGMWIQENETWNFGAGFDFSNVEFNPPPPYAPYRFTDPFVLRIFKKEDQKLSIEGHLADLMTADVHMDLTQHDMIPEGNISILTREARQENQVQVSLRLSDWTDDTTRWLIKQLDTASVPQEFLKFDLEIDHFQGYGQSYEHLFIDFDPTQQGALLSVYHDLLEGKLFFPKQPLDSWKVHFKKLNWQTESKLGEFKIDPAFTPQMIPAMDLSIESLKVNQNPLGAFSAHITKQKEGILFQEVKWTHPHFEVVVMGDWVHSEKLASPSMLGLSGRISSDAWDEFLKAIGFEKSAFKAKAGHVDFVLTWPGAPYVFDRKRALGSVFFDWSSGALMDVNPTIARFIDLMSISALNKRLQLSNHDLKGDDLLFDRFTGQYTLESGILKTHNANLTGPTLDFTMIGSIDLNQKTLDQKMRVKPHLGNSMVVVASVIGGPVAGAVTWLADRIMGNTILKDKAVMYQLKGDWDHYDLVPLKTE